MNEEDDTNAGRGNAAAIIDAIERMHGVRVLESIGDASGTLVAVPKGMEVHSVAEHIEEARTEPKRKKGFARLTEVKSFCDHFQRYSGPGSVVFVDRSRPALRAVYNYNGGNGDGPQFCDYGAEYTFPFSDEWEAWRDVSDRKLSVSEFAEFLEDHSADILNPESIRDGAKVLGAAMRVTFAKPSEVMEASRGLSVHVKHEIAHHQNLSTGECEIAFRETHEGPQGRPLKVPGAFVLGIPVFRGADEADALVVRLRYRAAGGKPHWSFKLHRPDDVLDTALRAVVEKVGDATGARMYWGTPER